MMTPPAEQGGPTASQLDEVLHLARSLAVDAGELIQSMRASIDLAGDTKSSTVDLVTAADRAAEALIADRLASQRPNDAILGEEGTGKGGSSDVRWIIDPIDGTTNYVYGIPSYCVSIAVEIAGVPAVGVVYEPVAGDCYAAHAGGAATKNGVPISVNQDPSLETALVATGFGYVADRRRGQAEVLLGLLPSVRDIRRFGSAALDLCHVAEGQVDAYYERGLNLWDLAAGVVIAEAAGAVVGDLRGNQPSDVFTLAANPHVFESLRTLLVELDADRKP
jgi:myo-inositol-1(or 4)-monophosphatase